MKKQSLLKITLIIILGTLVFCEVKDSIAGDKQIFFIRWIHSNQGYAEKVEVKALVLNDDQVVRLLTNPQDDFSQPFQKELYLKNVNVVLRIKNQGGAIAWGTLKWKLGNDENWFKIDICNLPPSYVKQVKDFYNFIIPIGVIVGVDSDLPPNPIQVKWDSLYTSRK